MYTAPTAAIFLLDLEVGTKLDFSPRFSPRFGRDAVVLHGTLWEQEALQTIEYKGYRAEQ